MLAAGLTKTALRKKLINQLAFRFRYHAPQIDLCVAVPKTKEMSFDISLLRLFCRGTRIRTWDPLVPNQMR